MVDLHKLDTETAEDYKMRICSLKETLDKNWDQIAAIINKELGLDYTESKYRKDYKRALIDGLALGHGDVVDTNGLDAMNKVKTEISIERQKLYAEKLELTRQLRVQSRFELFYEKIADAVKTLPLPEFQSIETVEHKREYVLTLADIHYGAAFETETNTYSRMIAQTRLEYLCYLVGEYVQANHISHLTVLELGDCIEGILRLSDLNINDGPVVDCVVEVSRLLAQFLNNLSKYCTIDFYAVPSANHSQTRPLGSKASELATEDLERIVVNYVSDMLALNDRVTTHVDLDKDYISFSIFGYECLALHGHQCKNIKTAIKDYSGLHQKFYSYLFMGHFHCAQEITVGERGLHNCEVLTSGAIMGCSPYSDSILQASKASAKIYEFDETDGHIGSRTFILN